MVTPLGLIHEAERLGARFYVVGEQLRARPANVLTPQLARRIGDCKAEVMTELRRRDAASEIPTLGSSAVCTICKRLDRCYDLAIGSCCASCAEWRTTCPKFAVLHSTIENARMGACLGCGSSWELHGSPGSASWSLVNDLDAVVLIEAQLVVANARAILSHSQ